MSSEKMIVRRLPPIDSPTNMKKEITPRITDRYEGLTGPKYKIGSVNAHYNLPPPKVLKPFIDTNAGTLDTWPAHASGQAVSQTSVGLSRSKELVIVDEEAQGKPQLIPKPKFLEMLESFLKKELRSLGVTAVEPNELRLQAHREVFEYLVEDFKTYKPILSAIKNEYEMMIAYQSEQIRQLEPLKQMLVTVSEQCDQKIVQIREEEKQEMTDLKKENQRLYTRIEEMKNQEVSLQTQVERLQEELAAEYLKYRDECDARKLLVSDINDLRYQQEDFLMGKQQQSEEKDEDDPVMLKIALKQAREDEKEATARLNEMTANYGDVIPRRDYEALENQTKNLNEKYSTSLGDFDKLKAEHDALLDVHKQVVEQRDQFYIECETLRRTATPRPEWEKAGDHVTGGLARWQEISEGKTSNELVDLLIEEVQGAGDSASGAEYFDGQGVDENVPKYLRFEGQVRNRRLGKRDTALLIRDIWREKASHDAEKTDGKREKMDDFMYIYLQRRFALEQMIIEWGYNLLDSCERFAEADPNIGLFYKVLVGKGDEAIFHRDLRNMAKLLKHLTQADADKGNTGTLTKEDFKIALQQYYPEKDEEKINKLIEQAEIELEAKDEEVLEYRNMFMEDDEGNMGEFLTEVKKQGKDAKLEYVEEIKEHFGEATELSVEELRKAISTVDPTIDATSLDNYISWVFEIEKEKLSQETPAPVNVNVVKQRLRDGNIFRVGAKAT
ncbi:unnamed protein product [Owenia fusiformis]|uniref:Uncharacterized protein n=1 Tax=Owenia fusiformis TaxID=6347 RepID=A0A8J1TUM3_OWEFU|nr:unnamed protein product [Owenia fusiformis]